MLDLFTSRGWRPLIAWGLAGGMWVAGYAQTSPQELTAIYAEKVAPRLTLPADQAQRYAVLLEQALQDAGLVDLSDQYLVLVDRSPQVQAVLLYWRAQGVLAQLIGASPAATGRPGRFDYFETPLGVFDHSTANLDYRAEGTKNKFGIRGYGVKGMRVFDLGWQLAPKGWGDQRVITMRLQMHATDPELLEPYLGSARSKGCIRIPASLNRLLDHYGLLDADYEHALQAGQGRRLWMLLPERQPVPGAGRYVVVVDSQSVQRPSWSPAPQAFR
jgi:hypothetical protein